MGYSKVIWNAVDRQYHFLDPANGGLGPVANVQTNGTVAWAQLPDTHGYEFVDAVGGPLSPQGPLTSDLQSIFAKLDTGSHTTPLGGGGTPSGNSGNMPVNGPGGGSIHLVKNGDGTVNIVDNTGDVVSKGLTPADAKVQTNLITNQGIKPYEAAQATSAAPNLKLIDGQLIDQTTGQPATYTQNITTIQTPNGPQQVVTGYTVADSNGNSFQLTAGPNGYQVNGQGPAMPLETFKAPDGSTVYQLDTRNSNGTFTPANSINSGSPSLGIDSSSNSLIYGSNGNMQQVMGVAAPGANGGQIVLSTLSGQPIFGTNPQTGQPFTVTPDANGNFALGGQSYNFNSNTSAITANALPGGVGPGVISTPGGPASSITLPGNPASTSSPGGNPNAAPTLQSLSPAAKSFVDPNTGVPYVQTPNGQWQAQQITPVYATDTNGNNIALMGFKLNGTEYDMNPNTNQITYNGQQYNVGFTTNADGTQSLSLGYLTDPSDPTSFQSGLNTPGSGAGGSGGSSSGNKVMSGAGMTTMQKALTVFGLFSLAYGGYELGKTGTVNAQSIISLGFGLMQTAQNLATALAKNTGFLWKDFQHIPLLNKLQGMKGAMLLSAAITALGILAGRIGKPSNQKTGPGDTPPVGGTGGGNGSGTPSGTSTPQAWWKNSALAGHVFLIGLGVTSLGVGISFIQGSPAVQQIHIPSSQLSTVNAELESAVTGSSFTANGGSFPASPIGNVYIYPSGDGISTPDQVVYVTQDASGGYDVNKVSLNFNGQVWGASSPNNSLISFFTMDPNTGALIPNPQANPATMTQTQTAMAQVAASNVANAPSAEAAARMGTLQGHAFLYNSVFNSSSH